MNALTVLLVLAGLYGLVIGSFLNVVAYRMPERIPLTRESRCPSCDARIRWWQNIPVVSWLALRGRCANCRAPISPVYPIVEAATGVAFVVVAAGAVASRPEGAQGWVTDVSFWLVLIAFLFFASVSILLTLIDLDTQRLPRAIVLPGIAVGVLLLGGASLTGEGWQPFARALGGGAILYVVYLVIRLINSRGMGGGDVTLAALIGLYLGWCGWAALAVGAFAAFVLGGLFGLALILLRRAGRKTAIPFGPWMLAGAWVGIAVGQPIGDWYVGLLK